MAQLDPIGLRLRCSVCGQEFFICRSCFRGHRYCSNACRKRGYESVRKKARLKYSKTWEARSDHRDRQRLHRVRLKNRKTTTPFSVTDQSSVNETTEVLQKQSADVDLQFFLEGQVPNRCRFCGIEVTVVYGSIDEYFGRCRT